MRRTAVRCASAAVLVLLLGLGAAGFGLTRATAHAQERRLLQERAGEVGVLLTSAFNNVASTLGLLGEAYTARRTAGITFTATAKSLLAANVVGVGVAELVGGEP